MLFQDECPQSVSRRALKIERRLSPIGLVGSPHIRSSGEAKRGRDYRLTIMFASSARSRPAASESATDQCPL